MRDLLLFACVLLAFGLGALPMRRLDRYLERRRDAAERAPEGEAVGREAAPARGARGRWLPVRRHRLGA